MKSAQNLLKMTAGFQRVAFQNFSNLMAVAQNQSEKILNIWLDKVQWIQSESLAAVDTWIQSNKARRDFIKDMVDRQLDKAAGK